MITLDYLVLVVTVSNTVHYKTSTSFTAAVRKVGNNLVCHYIRGLYDRGYS